jgi:hypothetical protein
MGVRRAAARARRIARAVSAIVKAEVTLRPRVRSDLRAAVSCSRSAATRALDSMYRTPAVSAGVPLPLRFATIGVNQRGSSAGWKPDIRPVFCGLTGFERRANHSGVDQLVEAARRGLCLYAWRHELRNYSAMRGDGDSLASLNPPDVAAQIVFEFPDARGRHHRIIATCGHTGNC